MSENQSPPFKEEVNGDCESGHTTAQSQEMRLPASKENRAGSSFLERVRPSLKPKSFQHQSGGDIFLVKGKDSTHRAAWYYVRIPALKSRSFEQVSGKVNVNLNDWGTILRSGYGDSPPEEVVAWAEAELGFRG